MVNTEPFNNYGLNEMFGVYSQTVVGVVNSLLSSIIANVAK